MPELPLKAALRALEPLACHDDQQVMHEANGVLSVPHVAALSQAISLKRLADNSDRIATAMENLSEHLAHPEWGLVPTISRATRK